MVEDLSWPARLRLMWRLLRDDRVSPWLKRLGPIGALVYVLSPIDLIPDFFLGIGQLDDLGVIAVVGVVLVKLMVRFAPPDVVAEHLSGASRSRHGDAPDDRSAMDVPFRERREQR
ncbi:MAG: DUF1232 domain-containing protein [Chloroflexia bacterium]|nr:DUF1232 domain-containing protein [Chloroflexia bacterium]